MSTIDSRLLRAEKVAAEIVTIEQPRDLSPATQAYIQSLVALLRVMDAAQEARVAEINGALRRRGTDEVTGAERRKLVAELTDLLTGPAAAEPEIAPEKRTRLDQINELLRRDAAATEATGRMRVNERHELVREASDILLGAGGGTPPEAA